MASRASYTASGHMRAFLWQDGTMRDLGTLAGAADSLDFEPTDVTAVAVNGCGEIVGSDHRPWVEDGHALLWFAPNHVALQHDAFGAGDRGADWLRGGSSPSVPPDDRSPGPTG